MPAQCPRVTSDLDSSVLIISSLEDLRHLRSVATHDDVLHGRDYDGVGVVGGVLGLVLDLVKSYTFSPQLFLCSIFMW